MTLDSAKRMLLDVTSYAYFRGNDVPPFTPDDVKEAIELVWQDTFGKPMDEVDRAGMYIATEEDKQHLREIAGE